ncbi:geraniol 8-hydroxylase-like [Gastrolobium bilobum]|uniref:geraniol 8-hydroxylase-like n=1 Tax=Gastrolobium bilobum TaxID=150636 RepID=UPI002AB1D2D3|nr:geraniol 8-hydroxylase-like [Gastrolobium bilobum]
MEFLSCVLLLVLTFTLAQALRSLLSRGKNAKYKLPPGPSPLPIVGNLLALGKKPHQSLAKLAQIYGPIMCLKLGQVTTIVVSSAEMAKEVLQTHDQFLSNRDVPHAVEVFNHEKYSMTFLPVSPQWRDLRKICNTQLFSNKTLDASQDLRRMKLQELLHDINQSSLISEAVDIGAAAFNTVINLLSNTIFSVDLFESAGSAGDFKETVTHIMKECGKPNLADFYPALKKVDPQRINSRNGFYAGKVIDIFRRLVDQRLKLREVQSAADTHNDMLNTLLNIAQENSQEMDKTKIEHLSLTLFVAGTDPVTHTLEWAMAELLQNAQAMEKAKQELEQTIGKGKPVEESDIARLPYLQAVIKETLRLHPPVPLLIPRKADENVEICGYTIPKGARVLVNVWAIGRNSSSWKDANVFSPERFLSSEIDVKGRNYELTPFGSGRRVCPGLLFAMRMLYLMLGSILNCFNWRLEDGMSIEDMNMDDNFGLALAKAEPVRIIPEKISN